MNTIYKYQTSSLDLELLDKTPGVEKPSIEDKYDDVIVKKPWGYEYLAFDNGQVAIWILHVARKRKTSMHCHPNKTTGLIVLSGNVLCSNLEESKKLNELDSVEIAKGCFHATEAASESSIYPPSENGVFLMEIEAPSNKRDLIRANDTYGRQGKAYEGKENLVHYAKEWLKLEIPDRGSYFEKKILGCQFKVTNGFLEQTDNKTKNIIAVLGYLGPSETHDQNLRVGGIYAQQEIECLIDDSEMQDYLFLTIEKEKQLMRLSDYVVSFLEGKGIKEIFAVSGGGAMHLVDAVGKNEDINYIAMHHEQAAAMSAEAYSRITNNLGVALVTTGPGGTNALTGVAGAWIDSIPTMFISGQVTRDTLIGDSGLRQYGIQESDITTLVKPITKYAVTVQDEADIRYEMEKAYHIANSGRPGPVWIDIPLDIQSKMVFPNKLRRYSPENYNNTLKPKSIADQAKLALDMIKKSDRPVLICGYGVRLSHAEKEFIELVKQLNIPVVTSWTASDLIDTAAPNYVGRCGIFGDRASNFAVQNSDLLLVLGCRLSIAQIGYNYKRFARAADLIMVDIDPTEINKESLHVTLPIVSDAKYFIAAILKHALDGQYHPTHNNWLSQCMEWKNKYPVVLAEYSDNKNKINSFFFIDQLANQLDENAVVVTDMGTSFTCTMQAFRVKKGQRLTTSSGHASMGFGLPGSIGACFANNRNKTICISGDGGLQMNIQELQTIVHYDLPIILFVINNGGYLTIKHMQQNHFGRYVGSEVSSGLSCPDTLKVAQAYGIGAIRINNQKELLDKLPDVLNKKGPYICEIMMPEDQPLIPRCSSLKTPDGKIISKPLEDLYPFLPREEFDNNMLIDKAEVLED